MKHVVITGGSRGIGKALALEFLRAGCSVLISGRDAGRLEDAVSSLMTESGNKNITGHTCDVTNPREIRYLWNHASAIHKVDYWINNAGINHLPHPLHELGEELISDVVETNITGTVLGTRIAIEGMLKQGSGCIYNLEGFGSTGRTMKGMSIYGTTKNAIHYFTRSVILEYRGSGVKIGSISPGMVVTDMLLEPLRLEPGEYRRALAVFHILADPASRVTPWIVRKILKNSRHGHRIIWLTRSKISLRFLMSMFRKRVVEGLPESA
jgi:NAD(P)-dependent dehydrogenase (short-subunit alcohol dehydrogenase family)